MKLALNIQSAICELVPYNGNQMHAIFFLRNSQNSFPQARSVLRGLSNNCPHLSKVWIFGERPDFISTNRAVIEQVPQEALARIGKFKVPVTNFFLLTWISSLIPELSPEYLRFLDDTITLAPLSQEDACKDRYIEDLSEVQDRSTGLWNESLWRTYDLLKRLGYSGYNFETHCPTFYTKRRVLEAYCDFKDFVTQDRWQGMLGPTAILNHAYRRENFPLIKLADEGRHVGFYNRKHSYEEIVAGCEGKTFLSFDDAAFDGNMQRFLQERFPEPCKFEKYERAAWPGVGKLPGDLDKQATKNVSVNPHNVLFALECGDINEQLARLRPLFHALSQVGKKIFVASSNRELSRSLLADLNVTLFASPSCHSSGNTPPLSVDGLAYQPIIQSDRRVFSMAYRAWLKLFEQSQPSTIVCDHAPTALLAARATSARRIVIGNGYTLPGISNAVQSEHLLLSQINDRLTALRGTTLSALSDLYQSVDGQILATVPELDRDRDFRPAHAEYYGVLVDSSRTKFSWPDHPGKKVLAYLQPFRMLPVLLEQLSRLNASSFIVCPEISEDLIYRYAGTKVQIVREPLSWSSASLQCDIAISHGSHDFATTMFVARKPHLMLPRNIEQNAFALQIASYGLGMNAALDVPREMIATLRKIWELPPPERNEAKPRLQASLQDAIDVILGARRTQSK